MTSKTSLISQVGKWANTSLFAYLAHLTGQVGKYWANTPIFAWANTPGQISPSLERGDYLPNGCIALTPPLTRSNICPEFLPT